MPRPPRLRRRAVRLGGRQAEALLGGLDADRLLLAAGDGHLPRHPGGALTFGLYKTFFHLILCVQESIILLLPPPICIVHTTAILLRDVCAIYDLPPTLPVYAIHHTILVIAISCKGQPAPCPCLCVYTLLRCFDMPLPVHVYPSQVLDMQMMSHHLQRAPHFFCFFCISHIIQLTPQKLSVARENLPGATGAGVWPEDQKLHRGRRPGRRRYQEVLLLEQRVEKKDIGPRRTRSRRCTPPFGVVVVVEVAKSMLPPSYPYA